MWSVPSCYSIIREVNEKFLSCSELISLRIKGNNRVTLKSIVKKIARI